MGRRGTRFFLLFALVVTYLVPTGADGAVGPATIQRDQKYGVPHITAPSQDAMAFAMGFALVEDRPFQVDLFRRAGQGRLSEVLGPGDENEFIDADVLMRREFFDRDRLQAEVDGWDPQLRKLWQAYADGITAGWAEVLSDPSTHPVEFLASSYAPEPWTVLDSLSVTLLFTIVDNGAWGGEGEGENAALLRNLGDDDRWREALWMNDPDTSTVIPNADAPPKPDGVGHVPDEIPDEQRGFNPVPIASAAADADLMTRVVRDLGLPKLGSYAVAVGDELTQGEGTMFIGAPQSGVTLPPVVWEVGLHAPGIDCAGGAVPGAGPFLVMGRCDHHAFTIVAGVAGDTVDVVVEKLSGDGYEYDGATERFETRTERFVVRQTPTDPDEPPPAPQIFIEEFRRTRHGPVYEDDGQFAYVNKRAQDGHVIDNLTSLFHLTTAQTLAEADAAVEEASWSVHYLYADNEDHIAYWYAGLNPIRSRLLDPRLPTPGHSSAFEWDGFIPKSENPHVADPAQGLLVANQGYDSKPVHWWPMSDDWRIGNVDRRVVTEAMVADLAPIDGADIEEINKLACCSVDPIVGYFTDIVTDAVSRHPESGRRNEAIQLLQEWKNDDYERVDADADGFYDHPAVAIWSADELPQGVYHGTLGASPIWDALYYKIFVGDIPGFGYYGIQDRMQMSERALRQERGETVGHPLTRSYYFDRPWDELVVEALDEGLGSFGDLRSQRAPVNTIAVDALGALPLVDADGEDRGIRGFDHSSYNFIIDFGSERSGLSVLPPGQGSPVSAADYAQFEIDKTYPEHYIDQIDLYENFEFKDLNLFAEEFAGLPVDRTLVYPGPLTNSAPHATDDEGATAEDTAVDVDALGNDYDPDGDEITIASVGQPEHGTAAVVSPGVIRYTPAANFHGADSFTYTVTDGSLTDDGRVDVDVSSVPDPRSLLVGRTGSGGGRVTSVPGGIDCGSDCTEDYEVGTEVTLSASASPGSRFGGWTGDCSGSAVECTVTMSDVRSVVATFEALGTNGIVFSTKRYGKEEIAVVADGRISRLTKNRWTDMSPSVSPDGTKVALVSNRHGRDDVYVMNIDGSQQIRLTTDRGTDRDPTWSPDGSRIFFSTSRFGNDEIASMAPDGTGFTRLTSNEVSDRSPAVSPDGTEVAFSSDGRLALMGADGSNVTAITDGSSNDIHPAWAVDGERIVFATNRFGNYEIASMARDGSDLSRLTTQGASDLTPRVAPSGSSIAFASDRGRDWDVYVMDADGSNVRRLTSHRKTDRGPSWIPAT